MKNYLKNNKKKYKLKKGGNNQYENFNFGNLGENNNPSGNINFGNFGENNNLSGNINFGNLGENNNLSENINFGNFGEIFQNVVNNRKDLKEKNNLEIVINNINAKSETKNLKNLSFENLVEKIKQKKNENLLNISNILIYLDSLIKFIEIRTFLKETKNNNNLNSEIIMVEIKLKNNKNNNQNSVIIEWGSLKNFRDQLNVLLVEIKSSININGSEPEENIINQVWNYIKNDNTLFEIQKNYLLEEIIKIMKELNNNNNFNKNSNNSYNLNEIQKILYELNETQNINKNINIIIKLKSLINELKKSKNQKIKEIINNIIYYVNSINIKKYDMILGFLLNCTIKKYLDSNFNKTLFINMYNYRNSILQLFENDIF